MAIRQPLTIYTGSDLDSSQSFVGEWYNDRGGMQYNYTPSDSEDDYAQDSVSHDRSDSDNSYTQDAQTTQCTSVVAGAAQDQLGEATYTANDAPYVYRPWPQTYTDARDEGEDDIDTAPSTATVDADGQNPYQTFYDLSYYGYGDYDFTQLSRTTTTYSVPERAHDEEDGDAEDDDEEDDDEEDDDDMNLPSRRWHCPRPER